MAKGKLEWGTWDEWIGAAVAVAGLLTYLLSDNRRLTSASLLVSAVVACYVAFRALQKKK